MIIVKIKKIIKQHRILLKIARKILKKEIKIYTFDDLNLMVDDWCNFLPKNLDVIIGIPRGGLMVANIISLNLGIGLSTPNNFINNEIWFSSNLIKPQIIKNVLVVEDSIEYGRELFKTINILRQNFPNINFFSASLVQIDNKVKIDFIYCFAEYFIAKGDIPKVLLDRKVARLEDLI